MDKKPTPSPGLHPDLYFTPSPISPHFLSTSLILSQDHLPATPTL